MKGLTRSIRIAVIGARASGKSYLLHDLIHAFRSMGYVPEELPLSYPHSSFGAFFYDAFNVETGGMRGTESYACRPENHYGALLSLPSRWGLRLSPSLDIDFLNIPGEVFDPNSQRLKLFHDLIRLITAKGKGLFELSTWSCPSGHTLRLIVPVGFQWDAIGKVKVSSRSRYGNYMGWENLHEELTTGHYQETEREPISGKQLLQRITELQTDSVLLSLEQVWSHLTTIQKLDLQECRAQRVLHYFYPLMYCRQATDLILCDRLTSDENTGTLAETMSAFIEQRDQRPPHVYLAFREADKLLRREGWHAQRQMPSRSESSSSLRHTLYTQVLEEIQQSLTSSDSHPQLVTLTDEDRRHILQCLGDGIGHAFWLLLLTAEDDSLMGKLRRKIMHKKSIFELSNAPESILPPHVYFTATPIDEAMHIYVNDPNDVTRFYCDEENHLRSFTRELCDNRVRHLCFGSYQLLTDILLQHGISPKGMSYAANNSSLSRIIDESNHTI